MSKIQTKIDRDECWCGCNLDNEHYYKIMYYTAAVSIYCKTCGFNDPCHIFKEEYR